MEVSGRLHSQAALLRWKTPQNTKNRMLGGSENRSGCSEEEKNLSLLAGFEQDSPELFAVPIKPPTYEQCHEMFECSSYEVGIALS